MEENKVLRKNQFKVIPIDISCEMINNQLRVIAKYPYDDFGKCPVIKNTGLPYSEHPLLRPFDKFFKKGDQNIGKVTYVFLFYEKARRPAIIFSMVKTDKRILILPAWGTGNLKSINKSDDVKECPIDHITIEDNQKGKISIHYTSSPSKGEMKKRPFPKATPIMQDKNGIHIGTLGVNDLKDLDPLGIVYRDINLEDSPRKTCDEISPILKEALMDKHPVFRLPPEFVWNATNHLEISLTLIGDKLENARYPKIEIIPHVKDPVEQLNKIPIDNKRSLLITFTLCPNKLTNSFQWLVRRKKLR